ncbi:ABC transporter ATP-binding protein [Dictyobacter kobayashii]|uniref:Daunorubicin resistance protein DrrA family ABC transporter ATP-binding protein n=1 Tax=Dictyobacter kobayashii TaxID=2014872 RepID=A0A402AQV9_9CHLR|nr:ABC transporter ATP-binding protein [Dictyobacter kobayashii]GCE21480.1 daunorubicin resistance protein DrrA family ABC transporter ATP-binding protein [Dictyobacter kobayashii]
MAVYIDPVLEVQNIAKQYPGVPFNAVDNVSFSIGRGEILGLLGPNGAGKTTTVSMLTTRMRPSSGTIHIMGIDIQAQPAKVMQHIAVVPQQSNLDQSLRVREILTFHAAYHGIAKREREQRAAQLLKELGLAERANEKVGYYSGGMGQRVMIARALMHNPSILFLDEPTNRLDPQSRLFLWERIQLLKKQGMAILLTTHDLEEADQLCDRIAIMDRGRILNLNTPEELKKDIPGITRLELRVHLPQSVATETIQQKLAALTDVTKVEELADDKNVPDIRIYRLYAQNTGETFAMANAVFTAEGCELLDVNIHRTSLEDVFIHLTGRSLRA